MEKDILTRKFVLFIVQFKSNQISNRKLGIELKDCWKALKLEIWHFWLRRLCLAQQPLDSPLIATGGGISGVGGFSCGRFRSRSGGRCSCSGGGFSAGVGFFGVICCFRSGLFSVRPLLWTLKRHKTESYKSLKITQTNLDAEQ